MKIGIFDSGLGGLVVLRELRNQLRNYNYVYLGDTKHLPYGDKSQEQIYRLTKQAVKFLFEQNCALVVIACNTSSSKALRKLQRVYLPQSPYRDRKIIGIIRPTAELAGSFSSIGLIGTRRTMDSRAYLRELRKINPHIRTQQLATPQLVPMIEAGLVDKIILDKYLKQFDAAKINALVLACTHYCLIKQDVARFFPKRVKIIAQDELLPRKLKKYLQSHPEISRDLDRRAKLELLVTESNLRYKRLAQGWFGPAAKLTQVYY